MWANLDRFRRDESGQSAIEYALLAGLVGCLLVAGARRLGTTLNGKLGAIATAVGSGSTVP